MTDNPQPDRRERYAGAIHDAMEPDLSLVDQEPGCQALFARAAEAAVALADTEQAELRRKLATAERIRENADFHLGQEMARRQVAEKETTRLRAVVARLRQMTDHWEKQLPEVIRTPAVVSAIRAALEAADRPASTAPLAAGLPLVQGRCPACQRASLFLGSGGYVTCSSADCPEPDAATTVLEGDANWPADRAAILREAADIAARFNSDCQNCAVELEVATKLRRMADEAQQPETQADDRAAIIAEILPAWEAVYEPGNVSDYLIGYANDEAPAKAAAEAWMRSQAEVTGRLEWVPDERLATGRYDQWFELVERHADGIDTGPGLIVRRRVADEAQPVCACDPAPHREQDGTYSHWAGCPIADAQQQADGTQGPAPDVVAVIVAALQERAGELSELAEEQMRPSLEERAQEWHEAAEVARKAAAAVSQPGKEA